MSTRETGLSVIAGLVIALVIVGPINAVIYAKTASVLWDWFLRVEYGHGPSLGAWYGASVIFGLMNLKTEKSKMLEGFSLLAQVFLSIVVTLLGCGLTLAAAYFVRLVII